MVACDSSDSGLPARWASGFSGDHQQDHQCLWLLLCYSFVLSFIVCILLGIKLLLLLLLGVAMPVHRSIQDDQVAPPTVMVPLTTTSPMHQVSLGHLAGRWNRCPAARSLFITVWVVMCWPERLITCILRCRAEMKWCTLAIRSKWRSSLIVDISLPPRFIRSPLLSIAQQDFTNAPLCHVQNSRHLILRITQCWQQGNLSQNMLR